MNGHGQCGCGQRGHLEAYVGALAVVSPRSRNVGRRQAFQPAVAARPRRTADAAAAGRRGRTRRLGWPWKSILETADFLAIGVVNAMHTVDPAGVVIGGAMTFGGQGAAIGRQFLERVRSEVRRRALPALGQRTTIDFASWARMRALSARPGWPAGLTVERAAAETLTV